jgi:hypothetical protein
MPDMQYLMKTVDDALRTGRIDEAGALFVSAHGVAGFSPSLTKSGVNTPLTLSIRHRSMACKSPSTQGKTAYPSTEGIFQSPASSLRVNLWIRSQPS